MKENRVESALINQLLRCGTSVGANVHEAQYAQGTKDFISKFEIALKECNESEYWLELLFETNSINENEFKKFQNACIELRRMLVSSVTTLKSKGWKNMILPNDIKLLLTIHESADKYETEFISVDINSNIPYYYWFNGGNMWGNHTIKIALEE